MDNNREFSFQNHFYLAKLKLHFSQKKRYHNLYQKNESAILKVEASVAIKIQSDPFYSVRIQKSSGHISMNHQLSYG